MEVRQTIIWRKDLKVRKGKLAAQVAHASLNGFLALMRKIYCHDDYGNKWIKLDTEFGLDSYIGLWLEGNYTKIVLGCEDEQELLELYQNTLNANLPVVLITDNGLTEFNGVKTNTCIAIGPYDKEEIDKITRHLQPL
jgi:PTH2 family peptidyl-tRNA hydrolase